jgi:hypothetical protein
MLNKKAVMNGYQKHKEHEIPPRANGPNVNNFLQLMDGERVRIRFVYEVHTESGENQMLCMKMHDYYTPADKVFVRAVCGKMLEKSCYWCAVAENDLKKAGQAPKAEQKAAFREAYRKAAKDVFILPCLVLVQDQEAMKWRTESKLYALTWGVKTKLVDMYENGAVWEDPEGNARLTRDITAGNFLLSRLKDEANGKVSYSLEYQGDRPMKLSPPSFERIEQMVLESRPPRFQEAEALEHA